MSSKLSLLFCTSRFLEGLFEDVVILLAVSLVSISFPFRFSIEYSI